MSQQFGNTSTEELIEIDTPGNTCKTPSLLTFCETFYLVLLQLLNSSAYVAVPVIFLKFVIMRVKLS